MNTETLNAIALDRRAGDLEGAARPEGRSHTNRTEPASQECELGARSCGLPSHVVPVPIH